MRLFGFGYESDRAQKVSPLLALMSELAKDDNGRNVHWDVRIRQPCEGLAELPTDEALLLHLAETLAEAGWTRLGEASRLEDGYFRKDAAWQNCPRFGPLMLPPWSGIAKEMRANPRRVLWAEETQHSL